jgi:S-DNA-T family DNA segregation ATPase FtsK/SpoIIIE
MADEKQSASNNADAGVEQDERPEGNGKKRGQSGRPARAAQPKVVHGLRQEAVGFMVGALAVLVAIALYPPGGFWGGAEGVGDAGGAGSPSNRIGAFGSFIAWVLGLSFGYAAYEAPFLLAVLSIKLLLRRVVHYYFWTFPGLIVLLLCGATAFALFDATELKSDGGGIFGAFFASVMTGYLGFTGTVIVLATLVMVSIIAITGFSFVHATLVGFAAFVGLLIKGVKFLSGFLKERSEAKKASRRRKAPAVISSERAPEKPPEKPVEAEEKPESAEAVAEAGEVAAELQGQSGAADAAFVLPEVMLLDAPPAATTPVDASVFIERSKVLENKLHDFDVEGHVVEVRPGPIVTMYEFEPASGVKVGKIVNLSSDLAMAMRATGIRIIAPIPGKSVVGIEIANDERAPIGLRELLESQAFVESKSKLTVAIGKDISGAPYVADLARMPHLLIAGATGAGKSVFVNSLILSVLYKATPADVRFLMIDPKMLELAAYEGIPHLLTPVITDPRKAAGVLRTMVGEMGRRYKLMADLGGKNIEAYNSLVAGRGEVPPMREGANYAGPSDADAPLDHKKLPYIVVVIDELADLMMSSGKEVEECIVRLSQMARAAGIHLIVATQRPSVDVITGLIKTNFPARISFKVPSRTDSRTILDSGGAEALLGSGDMLMMPPGQSKLKRMHGPYVSEAEIKKVTDFVKAQAKPGPAYDMNIAETAEAGEAGGDNEEEDEEFLRRYDEAVAMAMELEMISTSYIQRRFRIGYNTAARIIEKMEAEGVVGPSQGSKPREVLKRKG